MAGPHQPAGLQDTASVLDAQALANGLATPSGLQTTNLTEIGEGRRTVVSLNLDRMADSVSGQTVVDPKGYLTDLKSIKVCPPSPPLIVSVPCLVDKSLVRR